MRSMTVSMPAPNNSNVEGLFLRTRVMTRAAMAFDAQPDAENVMQLRDALETLLQDDLKLDPAAMAKFYECFDKFLPDVPADGKRKGYDNNEHAQRSPFAERQAQAMDSRTVRRSSSFADRHPEVAHIKYT
jgi:hypothetical protein